MPRLVPVPDRPLLGIAFRLCSASCFAAMGLAIKLAGVRGVGVTEMIFYRSLFALPVIALWVLAGPGVAAVATRRPMAHLMRAGIGIVSMFFVFSGVKMLPLTEATALSFTAPIMATILSALLLAETVGRHRWLAVAAGFAGALLVIRPAATLGGLGVPLVLLGALGQAGVMVTVRQIARTEAVAAIVFWFTFASTVTVGLLMPFFARSHDPAAWALLAAIGLLGGVGQITMTASLRFAPVSVVVPFDYVQMPLAVLAGVLILADPLLASTVGGAAIIAASGLYTIYRERRRGAVPPLAAAPPEP